MQKYLPTSHAPTQVVATTIDSKIKVSHSFPTGHLLRIFDLLSVSRKKRLTGNPTATLSREILFIPACRLTPPVNVTLRFSRFP